MIRPLIIFFNLLVAFFVSLLTGTPSASVTAPFSAKPGEAFTIAVNIQTNGETDFLRYSMDLPEGWTAEKVETSGSSFRFEKQTVKFLWSRVGDVKELNVSFKVTPSATANGDYALPNKLAHTVDNLPSNIQLAEVKINVAGDPNAAKNQATYNQPDTTAKPSALINAERSVPSDEVSNTFEVGVTIHKDDLTGFGKYEDSIPAGYTAALISADGGNFKFEQGKVSFVWWNLPKKETLNVRYSVTVDPEAKTSAIAVTGIFSYVENSYGKIFQVPASTVKIKEIPQLVVDNSAKQTDQQNTVNTNDVAKTSDKTTDNSSAQQQQTDNSHKANDKVADNSKQQDQQQDTHKQTQDVQLQSGNSASVKYSIQIAAMSRQVPVSYYKSTYSISENVKMEQRNGLNKYTVGSFTTYADARSHREQIRGKGVEGPFVTAYNSGTRITVQEALMITNQKWIQ